MNIRFAIWCFCVCLPLFAQFASDTSHSSPATTPATPSPPEAGSQQQVTEALPSGNYFVASLSLTSISADTNRPLAINFDTFDSQFHLLAETIFQSTKAGEGFYGLLLDDLNGDGKPDLVAASEVPTGHGFGSPGIWVFLGNGDGTFQTGKRQMVDANPFLNFLSFLKKAIFPAASSFITKTSTPPANTLSGKGSDTVNDLTVDAQGNVYVAGATTSVSLPMSVRGVNAAVSYAGPQPTWTGLDQVNVLLPPSLAVRWATSTTMENRT